MKRRINTIKGKRLVVGGGTNLLSKDEILVTETSSGVELKERDSEGKIKELSGGSSDKLDIILSIFKEPVFYKVYLNVHDSDAGANIFLYNGPCLVLIKDKDKVSIEAPVSLIRTYDSLIEGWGYICIENLISQYTTDLLGISGTIKEFVANIHADHIIEITKEEFEKVFNEAE